LVQVFIPLEAQFGLVNFDPFELLEITVIDGVKAESLDDINYFVPSLLLANPSLLLVDFNNGFAGGNINIHES
jgi:hypothetical protein